ncbi:MAG: class I SAM-dependent methyltransferase [Minisyncoccia bacterium]
MNREGFDELLGNVRRKYGSFFSYDLNFEKTITPRKDLAIFFNRLLAIANDIFRDVPMKKIRILDLGSYEGIFSIGFAQLGAEVVSVEGREINSAKIKIAKEYLGLKKLDVIQTDVRAVNKEKYGRFDLVLACGIMYHLDVPSVFDVTKNIFDMTERSAIFDTHIALSRPVNHIYNGRSYWGKNHKEFNVGTSTYDKQLNLASALDNNESFWLTRISWLNLLKDLGFDTAYECLMPYVTREKGFYDRATFVAVKNPQFNPSFQVSTPDLLPEQIGAVVPTCQDEVPSPNKDGLLIR